VFFHDRHSLQKVGRVIENFTNSVVRRHLPPIGHCCGRVAP
jgi:hypothetical protein